MSNAQLNRWGSLCSIFAVLVMGFQFLAGLLKSPQGLPSLSGWPRLQAVLFLGMAAAAIHGVLWALIERGFHWKFGGGGTSLPQGWSAVVLSATMTVPLVLLPPLYSRVTHIQMVLPGHVLAACLVVISAAVGHLFLYGAKSLRFPGIRNLVFPLGSGPNRGRAIAMESIYALTHFSSIVLIYRVVVGSRVGPLNGETFVPVLISASVWLFGTWIFINLKYPDSLTDKTWIEIRGVIHATILAVTLEGGMLT
jgi:hypothetical protein